MKKIIGVACLAFLACNAQAQGSNDVQIAYCDSPEMASEMEARLPGYRFLPSHDGGNAASPRLHESIDLSGVARNRYFQQGGVVCIGVAVDAEGVAQDIYVHPSRVDYGRQAKRKLLGLEYSPGQIHGEAAPTILIISISGRIQ